MTIMIAVLAGTNLILIGVLIKAYLLLKEPPDQPARTPPEPMDPKSMAELEEVKRRLVAEELAFQRLMSYNVDTAYGLHKERGDGE